MRLPGDFKHAVESVLKILALLLFVLLIGATPLAVAQTTEPIVETPQVAGSLIRAPGWELVHAHCSGCHSITLVTSQRGERPFWKELIRWMQRTQNLWQFEPATEETILNYLATNYGAGRPQRRAPLAADLLPVAR
ncbi:MAG: hypothetical protein O3A63_11180 [Proteobacteria bacterium]|nr:hypothetical protein [Pseudomonadota bacterium]